jgi:DNA mismatch endonuclease (patch repair protein)
MVDVVPINVRRRMMSGIRSTNTIPERIVRSGLHRRGYRFRLHVVDMPGRPDIVLPKHAVAILVHGCFWHGHRCPLFRLPATRVRFWRNKIETNCRNDIRNHRRLLQRGWRVLTVWECALKGSGRISPDDLFARIERWMSTSHRSGTIRGYIRTR